MRAIYLNFKNFDLGNDLVIEGDQVNHLHVVRIKIGEELLILNGEGEELHGKLKLITKKNAVIEISRKNNYPLISEYKLAIALPKKDAFEDILKIAVELGVLEIFPLKSAYSQFEFEMSERFSKILESALIQSNNYYFPKIHRQQSLAEFLKSTNSPLYFFNSINSNQEKIVAVEKDFTVLIGPEGGFSEAEIRMIQAKAEAFTIHLPTPIQRAPTAVASSIGYLISKLK